MEDKVYLGTKTACVYDYGLFISCAERLARDFKTVYYFNPMWKQTFPKFIDAQVGAGLFESENIIRIEHFWNYFDEIDLFYFPDTLDADLQDHLRGLGKRVWGSGQCEALELYREEAIETLDELGLPTPEYEKVEGIDNLREYLKNHKDVYIKCDMYRGTFETFHAINYNLTSPLLDSLEQNLGPAKNLITFLCFKPIDGVELAADEYCVWGQYPEKTLLGWELKDVGWVGRVKPYKDLYPAIREFNEKIVPTLELNKYCNFMSPEMRIDKKGVGYMTDLCARHPSPVSEVYFELLENFSEIVWHGGNGTLIQPIFKEQFAMTLCIEVAWAEKHWTTLEFPKEIRRWIKLRNYTYIDGKYCIVPTVDGSTTVGVIVAIGKSIEDCAKKVNEIGDQIKGYQVKIEMAMVDKIMEVIKQGEAIGIKF